MTRKFFAIAICLALVACVTPDEEIIIPVREIEDTGIYDLSEIDNGGNEESLLCGPQPVNNDFGCWDLALDVSISCHYDSLFNRFGNGWTGADATYSTTLPDGRRLWLFGDTFLGTVNPDGSRPGGIPFINNSVVIEEGRNFETLYGGTQAVPRAFIEPPNPDHWYWPNDPTIHGNELHLLLSRMGRTGVGGMWDFHLVSTDLAIFSLPGLELISLEVKEPGDDVFWGAAVMEDDDYTYIYGIQDEGLNKFVSVARVAGGDMTGDWEFFDGTGWTDEPNGHTVKDGTSNQFSVFKSEGTYYLMTQKIVFSEELLLFKSSTPTGPWIDQKTLYCTPELGGNIFTYNAFVHPELSRDGDLFITYNVNSFDFSDLFSDVRNYRPRFIRVQNWQ